MLLEVGIIVGVLYASGQSPAHRAAAARALGRMVGRTMYSLRAARSTAVTFAQSMARHASASAGTPAAAETVRSLSTSLQSLQALRSETAGVLNVRGSLTSVMQQQHAAGAGGSATGTPAPHFSVLQDLSTEELAAAFPTAAGAGLSTSVSSARGGVASSASRAVPAEVLAVYDANSSVPQHVASSVPPRGEIAAHGAGGSVQSAAAFTATRQGGAAQGASTAAVLAAMYRQEVLAALQARHGAPHKLS